MTNYKKKLVIGTRSSRLALAQTRIFIDKLLSVYPDMSQDSIKICPIKTSGDQNEAVRLDQIGGKGLFAREIETEILKGTVDLGIHSMKDMPAEESDDLIIACWLERFDHRDALVSNKNHKSLSHLETNSIIGTSSIRRRSQIIHLRNDLVIRSLRGNIDTRISKLERQNYDSIILSVAGLKRLSLDHLISFIFEDEEILPAACQGAIGVQIKSDNQVLEKFLEPLNHQSTRMMCNIERNVLQIINANCNSPIGLLAEKKSDYIQLRCEIFDHDGNKIFSDKIKKTFSMSFQLGKEMAKNILSEIGQQKINSLDIIKNDFDYPPQV